MNIAKVVLLTAAASCVSCASAPNTPGYAPSSALSVCDVLEHWETHHLQTIQLRGIYISGFEKSVLYDPSCNVQRVWVSFPGSSESEPAGYTKKLRDLASHGGAAVVFEGVFYGPAKRTGVDPRLPPSIRVAFENAPIKYGHLGRYPAMITVLGVRSVSRVRKPD